MSPASQTLQKQLIAASNKENLPKNNLFFTGRNKVLSQLNKVFIKNKTTAITQIISGETGIGKTQIAIEFCHRYLKYYKAILWIKADDEISIINSYLDISQLLELVTPNSSEALKIDLIINLIKNWLITNSNWLMVWDSLENDTLIKQYLPSDYQGHILITTRCQSFKDNPELINLAKMSLTSGSLFLLKRVKLLNISEKTLEKALEKDKFIAQEIVKETNCLPLALELISAYINETKSSLSDYLVSYKEVKESIHIDKILDEQRHAYISILTIYKLTLDKINEKNPIAAKLLQAFSILSSCSIAKEIFIEPDSLLSSECSKIAEEFTNIGNLVDNGLAKLAEDSFYWDNISELLLSYSVIEQNTTNQTFSLHQLLQTVIFDLVDPSIKLYLAESLAKTLGGLTLKYLQTPNSWLQYQRLIPSALALLYFAKSMNVKLLENAKLFNQAGVYYNIKGFISESLEFFLQSLEIYKHHFGDDHIDVANTLNLITVVYDSQGKYAEALELCTQAYTIKKRYLGDNHLDIGLASWGLGNLSVVTSKEQQAIDYYKQALDIFDQLLPVHHPWIIQLLQLYSDLLLELNRKGAIAVYQKSH